MPQEKEYDHEQEAGELIAELLHLEAFRNYDPPRYDTEFGNKTAKGLTNSILGIFRDCGVIPNH